MEALGLVEVRGLLQAIVAADIALKAANVQLTKIEKIKGGLVTVVLNGDVGAINAAVEAIEHGITPDLLLSSHVIARPDQNVAKLFKEEVKEVVEKKETTTKEVVKEVKKPTTKKVDKK